MAELSIPVDGFAVSDELRDLCSKLQAKAGEVDRLGEWPAQQLQHLAQAGVYGWFVPAEYGGTQWNEREILAGYLALSQSCLTTTFILTQWQAACKRLVTSPNESLRAELLPPMAKGELHATVGISHLTTSRQHVKRPVLVANVEQDGSLTLDGFSPWVTGTAGADVILVGASTADGSQQYLAAVHRTAPGVTASRGADLVALSASCTDRVDFDQVHVAADQIVAGPSPAVLQAGTGGGAGGLQTSTLAAGLSLAASGFICEQAQHRAELQPAAEKIGADCEALVHRLLRQSDPASCSGSEGANDSVADIRQTANSLVLRSTQAALSAAKGAGFLSEHPVGRWAREALFFLVWSCPQPVAAANLCELAQIEFESH